MLQWTMEQSALKQVRIRPVLMQCCQRAGYHCPFRRGVKWNQPGAAWMPSLNFHITSPGWLHRHVSFNINNEKNWFWINALGEICCRQTSRVWSSVSFTGTFWNLASNWGAPGVDDFDLTDDFLSLLNLRKFLKYSSCSHSLSLSDWPCLIQLIYWYRQLSVMLFLCFYLIILTTCRLTNLVLRCSTGCFVLFVCLFCFSIKHIFPPPSPCPNVFVMCC